MLPIGVLMIEHRLIERMLHIAERKSREFAQLKSIDVPFVLALVDFFQNYTDRCHHGKEEDILFHELAKKNLSEPDRALMQELLDEHTLARQYATTLAAAGKRYAPGDAQTFTEIQETIAAILKLYPTHIAKEDKQFFLPAMRYFSAEEQADLLNKNVLFDQHLIHNIYKDVIAKYEEKKSDKNLLKPITEQPLDHAFDAEIVGGHE